MKILIRALLCLCTVMLYAQVFAAKYVSSNATDGGNGTLAQPWKLQYALDGAGGQILAGDTVFIKGGRYVGNFISKLNSVGPPVIFKNYDTSRVILDGYTGSTAGNLATLNLNNTNVWFMGLEITCSSAKRITNNLGGGDTTAVDFFVCTGVNLYGSKIKLINCVIHDNPGIGVGEWKLGNDNEVYGCSIYNNGFCKVQNGVVERGHGPGLYFQSSDSALPHKFINNFVFNNFWVGLEIKAVNKSPLGNALNGMRVDSNTVFNSCSLNYDTVIRHYNLYLGCEDSSYNPAKNISMYSNIFYRDDADGMRPFFDKNNGGALKPAHYRRLNICFGTGRVDSTLTFKNNYIVGNSAFGNIYVRNNFYKFNVTGNTVFDPSGVAKSFLIGTELFSNVDKLNPILLKSNAVSVWDSNRYASRLDSPFVKLNNGTVVGQEMGLKGLSAANNNADSKSSFVNGEIPDTAFIRRNHYEPNVFYVSVLNHSKRNLYNLFFDYKNLPRYYTVTDVQNQWGGNVTSGIYKNDSSKNIVLPMGLSIVDTAIGNTPRQPTHTLGLGTYIIRFADAPASSCNPPTGITVQYISDTALLNWTAASGAVKYYIQQMVGSVWQTVDSTTNTFFKVAKLDRYGNYNFRVATKCAVSTEVAVGSIVKTPGKYFVAVDSSSQKTGSISQPWPLAFACNGANSKLLPGDSVFIKAGVYKNVYLITQLNGSEAYPIVFRNYNGGRVTIDGFVRNTDTSVLVINDFCSNVQLVGLEVTSSATKRISTVAGDIKLQGGVAINGDNIKIINCVVHDMPSNGVSANLIAKNSELYGCLIYNNGHTPAAAGTNVGSGVVFQNANPATPKRISNNFIFRNYKAGLSILGNGGFVSTNGIITDSNTVFQTGALLATGVGRKYNLEVGNQKGTFPGQNLYFINNIFYRDTTDGLDTYESYKYRYNLELGIIGTGVDSSIVFRGNTVVGGHDLASIRGTVLKYDFHKNIFYSIYDPTNVLFNIYGAAVFPGPSTTWDSNYYYSPYITPFQNRSFDKWKDTFKIDTHSFYSRTGRPDNAFSIGRNKYEKDRYYVSVLNHANDLTFNIPFNNKALAGKRLVVIDAQNYYGPPVLDTLYLGGSVTLPMKLTAVGQAAGIVPKQPKHTSTNLGTFIFRFSDDISICPNGSTAFESNVKGNSYTWMVSTDSGKTYSTITDDNIYYEGTVTPKLQLVNIPAVYYGYMYRCTIDNIVGNYSDVFTIRYTNRWTGAIDSKWENAGNWSCGVLPDEYSDVVFYNGAVVEVSSTTSVCRTLSTMAGANLKTNPGSVLTVKKWYLSVMSESSFKVMPGSTVNIQ